MWLPWQWALVLAAGFAVAALSWGRSDNERAAVASQFAHEATIIAVLYAAWIFVGRFTLLQIDGAIERAETLWRVERVMGLPDEAALQDLFMAVPNVVKTANLYYGGMHVPVMGLFLVWFFATHRDSYSTWRNTLALLTALCVVIQLLPVAPPRLVPSLEMVDTGHYFNQSVFQPLGNSKIGQLQAMPSIHIAWAGLIAAAMWQNETGRLRWLGVVHLVATTIVVVITANHYWADGIVALVLLATIRSVAQALRARTGPEKAVEVAARKRSERVG